MRIDSRKRSELESPRRPLTVEDTQAGDGRRWLAVAVTGASAAGASRVLERALDRGPELGSGPRSAPSWLWGLGRVTQSSRAFSCTGDRALLPRVPWGSPE